MTTTKENLANPGPVGLCGFALTTWLLSLINGGFLLLKRVSAQFWAWLSPLVVSPKLLPVCLSSRKAIRSALPLLSAMAPFWWTWALFTIFFKGETAPVFIGWYLCAWGMFSLMMFVATLTKPKVLSGIFFFLDTDFLCLGHWQWHGKSQHRPYRRLLRLGNCTWCVLLGRCGSH